MSALRTAIREGGAPNPKPASARSGETPPTSGARPASWADLGSHGMTANPTAETLAAYERWAPLYPPHAHNPLMRAEQRAMCEHWPNVAGRRALDLAWGPDVMHDCWRPLRARRSWPWIFACPVRQAPPGTRVCGSMMQLPFADRAFDVVISGLALGHAANVRTWMAEVSRVLAGGGTLLYSDFHPDAARAGLPRSFKDQNDRTWICRTIATTWTRRGRQRQRPI